MDSDVTVGAPKQHRGVPTFFRARCEEASRGGTDGYKWVGYLLVQCLPEERPWDIEDDDEWEQELGLLNDLVMPTRPEDAPEGSLRWIDYAARDDAAVWRWFKERFPRMMLLIPARRRQQFLEGVYQAVEEVGLEM